MSEYIIQESSLMQLADIVRSKSMHIDASIDFISNREQFNISFLPEGITSIGSYAFYGCPNLALTSLPESITSIGDSAFFNCSNLALTSLPESITSIGYSAFAECSNLKSLTFKGTPTRISSNIFVGCENLTTINVPWSKGALSNAPWGATNATINYNYVEG